MKYFLHPNAICESKHIGSDTRIWAFAHILPGAVIGKNCNICDHTFIENDVIIGDNVTIKLFTYVCDSVTLEDNVFVGSNVNFTNTKFPRSKQYQKKYPKTIVKKGASIGSGSTILPGIIVGEKAMVGAGSLLTQSVPDKAIVTGNPATITGYVDDEDKAHQI